MVQIICPNCAANLEIPEAPIHTCEFCGTAIQVSLWVGQSSTGEITAEEIKNSVIFQDHYIVRCNYASSEAISIMEDWIKKVPGTDPQFEENSTITKRELKFYPMWVGEFTVSSDYRGLDDWPNFHQPAYDRAGWYEGVSYQQREESGHILREYQIPLFALQTIPKYLQDYIVPTTSKEYFDITHVKALGGKMIDSTYSVDDAKRTLRLAVLNRQMAEMRKEVHTITERNDKIEERDIFYIQFPVWQIEFQVDGSPGRKYEAYIDGSTGRVIHIDVPISKKFKILSLTAGLGQIAIGIGLVILGILIPSIIFLGVSAGVGLITYGGLLLSAGAKKGAQEKQV